MKPRENGSKPEEIIEEVLLISLKNFKTKEIITFGLRPYTPTRKDVNYVLCPTEYDLLIFLHWWESTGSEVVTGWNVSSFDIAYLSNRIPKVLLGEKHLKRLSPWGKVEIRFVEQRGRKQQRCQMDGITVLDYLELYRKFTFVNRESYRLDYISVELGVKKLDHSEFETFKDFYTNNWTKFVDYNLVDVDLVDQLEEKMKLIDLVMLMAYDAVNYVDTFTQVRLWDIIIYNYLRQNIVLDMFQER